MQQIYDKLKVADILVIASPVYFYGLSAQLKAIIDRLHNPRRDTFNIKKLAMILVGAATLPELFDAILMQYKLVLNFFKLEDGGTVLVRGAKEKGDVRQGDSLQAKLHFVDWMGAVRLNMRFDADTVAITAQENYQKQPITIRGIVERPQETITTKTN